MKYLLIAINIIILGLGAYGIGGCGGVDSTESFDASNFEGSYTLRDDGCSYSLPSRISVSQAGSTAVITIINAGSSEFSAGETFDATIRTDGSAPVLDSPDLGCGGVLVDSEDNALASVATINFELEDFLSVCNDALSADDVCYVSYQP